MSAWVREHFRDAKHARDTVAIGSFAIGAIGFLLIVTGLLFAHWGVHLP
jgi:hypothetical protein